MTTALSSTIRLYMALLPPICKNTCLRQQVSGTHTRLDTYIITHLLNVTRKHMKHFYPKTTSDWNLLSLQVIRARSLYEFKSLLTRHRFRPPIWYYYGPRVTSILLCQIRNCCSPLCDDFLITSSQTTTVRTM